MSIITKVGFYDFERAFIDAGRNDQFSYEGKRILYDYLSDMSRDIGEPVVLDVIALCCEYIESSLEQICSDYNMDFDPDLPEYSLHEVQEDFNVCGYYEDDDDGFVVVYQNL